MSEAVLSGVLTRRVAGQQIPFAPTLFDAELLTAADAALAGRVPLAFVLPSVTVSAPIMLAACAVVSAVLRRGKLNVQVALVSSRLADRALYDELAFRRELLAKLVPRAVVPPDGTPIVIGRPMSAAAGRMYMTASPSRLTFVLPELEGLIVTAGTVSSSELTLLLGATRARVPVIYLTGDPNDIRLTTVRDAGGLVWAWHPPALTALAEPAAPVRSQHAASLAAQAETLRSSACAVTTVHQPTGGGLLDGALERLWRAMSSLAAALSSGSHGPGTETAARWAWGAFNALALLPVTPSAYDRFAPSTPFQLRLSTVAEIAREFAHNASGRTRETWAELADAFADATDAAQVQPRSDQVIGWLAARVDATEAATLIVRNTVAAEALRAILNESPNTPLGWSDVVDLRTLASVAKSGAAGSQLCVAGTLPRGRAAMLALPPAAAVTVLACGPLETRRAVRMAVAVRTRLAELRRETVEVSGPRLRVATTRLEAFDPAAGVKVVEAGMVRSLTPVELDLSGQEPFDFDLLATLADAQADSDDDVSDFRLGSPAVAEFITVIQIHVAGASLFVEPNDIVTRRRGNALSRVAAKSLKAGDLLLLVNRAARTDLRVALTAKLSERTQFSTLRMLVEFWHQRAAIAGQTGELTHQQILDRMTGTTVTTAGTIGNWIRGDVDGPADHSDLSRFARAVNDDQLLSEAERVSLALRTLHTANRKLGRWLAAQVSGAADRRRDEVVDPDLGVHVSDLLDAISEHEVLTVDLTTSQVPARQVGILLT